MTVDVNVLSGATIGQSPLAAGTTNAGYPPGVTPVSATSGNVANASAVATLPAAAGKVTYLTGFEITAAGATGALVVTVTVVSNAVTLASYTFVFPAGATTSATPLVVELPTPIVGNGANASIVVTLPAGGTGNTNAVVNARGFQI